MKRFIQKVSVFSVMVGVILAAGILLPPTPRAKGSYFFSKIKKDKLLAEVKPPRLILMGGSGISFGINSRVIQEEMGLYPINTGIMGSLGLVFMMDCTLPYIKASDIVIIAPEYANFYGDNAYGGEALAKMLLDVEPSYFQKLRLKQWFNVIGFVPKTVATRFFPTEYINVKEDKINSINSYNEYGDIYTHWNLKPRAFVSLEDFPGEFNDTIISNLRIFERSIHERGGRMFITFPAFNHTSFSKCKSKIMRIEHQLEAAGFCLLGKAERYVFEDSMMFNSSYHLSKEGVDMRTGLLVDDLRMALAD